MDERRRGGGRIKIGYFPKYSPFDGCLNKAVAVCMPVVLQIIFFSLHFVTPWLLIQQKDTPFLWTVLRWFPFSKNPGLKFRTFHVPNATTRPDPTQATSRLVIILVSRIQKSVTEDNNFVHNQIFLSDRTEMVLSIWFLTETSKILGWMESAPSESTNLVGVVSFLCYFYFASPASFHYRALKTKINVSFIGSLS